MTNSPNTPTEVFTNTQNDVFERESELSLSHQQLILRKPILQKIYDYWYSLIAEALPNESVGPVVEIGSGGGFIKKIIPNAITSDVLPLPHVDMVFDALSLPFSDRSLGSIVMINVFHHLPNCETFLSEATRTLAPGGKIIMIEPSNCWWSRTIYQNLHHEPFDTQASTWQFNSIGPLTSSNQALPYIVFERDKQLFANKFPSLNVKRIQYHTPTLYLLSGGLSKPSLIPGFLHDVALKLDQQISGNHFHMFCLIEVEKV